MTQTLSHIALIAAFAAFMTAGITGAANAAPAMAHDKCRIKGIITAMEKITIERKQPQSWLDDWRLSAKYTETRVEIDAISIETIEDQPIDEASCTLEKAATGYYLKDKSMLKTLFADFKTGDCITAETNFSGDEFRIGNWIYDIEKRPVEQCSTAGKTEDKTE